MIPPSANANGAAAGHFSVVSPSSAAATYPCGLGQQPSYLPACHLSTCHSSHSRPVVGDLAAFPVLTWPPTPSASSHGHTKCRWMQSSGIENRATPGMWPSPNQQTLACGVGKQSWQPAATPRESSPYISTVTCVVAYESGVRCTAITLTVTTDLLFIPWLVAQWTCGYCPTTDPYSYEVSKRGCEIPETTLPNCL